MKFNPPSTRNDDDFPDIPAIPSIGPIKTKMNIMYTKEFPIEYEDGIEDEVTEETEETEEIQRKH